MAEALRLLVESSEDMIFSVNRAGVVKTARVNVCAIANCQRAGFMSNPFAMAGLLAMIEEITVE